MLRQSDRNHHIRYHILCIVGSACRGIEEVVPIIMSKEGHAKIIEYINLRLSSFRDLMMPLKWGF